MIELTISDFDNPRDSTFGVLDHLFEVFLARSGAPTPKVCHEDSFHTLGKHDGLNLSLSCLWERCKSPIVFSNERDFISHRQAHLDFCLGFFKEGFSKRFLQRVLIGFIGGELHLTENPLLDLCKSNVLTHDYNLTAR